MISSEKILGAVDILGRIKLLEYRSGCGGAPEFERPKSPQQLFDLAKKIATTINRNGSWNGRSGHAENYALCLERGGESLAAYQLFSAITGEAPEVLARPFRSKALEETAGRPGGLGYEGAFQFARLCLKFGHKTDGCKILLEIVTKVPTKCFPIRLQDIRVDALEILLRNGVAEHQGKDLRKELEAAKAHQY